MLVPIRSLRKSHTKTKQNEQEPWEKGPKETDRKWNRRDSGTGQIIVPEHSRKTNRSLSEKSCLWLGGCVSQPSVSQAIWEAGSLPDTLDQPGTL